MHDALRKLAKTDIYLLDQILRENVPENARVADLGCGSGRNLRFFLEQGHEVFGCDSDPVALVATRRMAAELGCVDPDTRFLQAAVESVDFEPGAFDLVICNAVLHFARDDAHFDLMTEAMHRLLRPGGMAFARLASTHGLEDRVEPRPESGENWYRLPDGSDRYLVSLEQLVRRTAELEVELVDPIKTVNVQNRRCMTTWVWRR